MILILRWYEDDQDHVHPAAKGELHEAHRLQDLQQHTGKIFSARHRLVADHKYHCRVISMWMTRCFQAIANPATEARYNYLQCKVADSVSSLFPASSTLYLVDSLLLRTNNIADNFLVHCCTIMQWCQQWYRASWTSVNHHPASTKSVMIQSVLKAPFSPVVCITDNLRSIIFTAGLTIPPAFWFFHTQRFFHTLTLRQSFRATRCNINKSCNSIQLMWLVQLRKLKQLTLHLMHLTSCNWCTWGSWVILIHPICLNQSTSQQSAHAGAYPRQ